MIKEYEKKRIFHLKKYNAFTKIGHIHTCIIKCYNDNLLTPNTWNFNCVILIWKSSREPRNIKSFCCCLCNSKRYLVLISNVNFMMPSYYQQNKEFYNFKRCKCLKIIPFHLLYFISNHDILNVGFLKLLLKYFAIKDKIICKQLCLKERR